MRNNQVFDKGNAVAADFNGVAFSVLGGAYVLGGFGVFGAGTLKVQWSPDDPTGATWVDLGAQNALPTLLTAAGMVSFKLLPGRYRVVFAGSTAPTLAYWFGEANESS